MCYAQHMSMTTDTSAVYVHVHTDNSGTNKHSQYEMYSLFYNCLFCNNHSKINRKIEISTLCRIAKFWNCILHTWLCHPMHKFWGRSVQRGVLKYMKYNTFGTCLTVQTFLINVQKLLFYNYCVRLLTRHIALNRHLPVMKIHTDPLCLACRK